MNKKIYEHVKLYWELEGYRTPDEEDVIGIIREWTPRQITVTEYITII